MRTDIFILLLLAGLFMTACGDKECKEPDENHGVIERNWDFPRCIFPRDGGEQYIIRDYTDLDTFDTCNPDSFGVDFANFSIIGQRATWDCNGKYVRTVTIDTVAQIYDYVIDVYECGKCKTLGISDNLVLVPKIPAGYTVRFSINEL